MEIKYQLAGNISPDPIDIDLNYTLQKSLLNYQKESTFLLNPYFNDPVEFIV